jgi:hypothetical protein
MGWAAHDYHAASPHQQRADAAYETAVAVMRERTRKADESPLVFDELCKFGFRRNLWGHRTLGVALAATGLRIAFGAAAFGVVGVIRVSIPTALAVGMVVAGGEYGQPASRRTARISRAARSSAASRVRCR